MHPRSSRISALAPTPSRPFHEAAAPLRICTRSRSPVRLAAHGQRVAQAGSDTSSHRTCLRDEYVDEEEEKDCDVCGDALPSLVHYLPSAAGDDSNRSHNSNSPVRRGVSNNEAERKDDARAAARRARRVVHMSSPTHQRAVLERAIAHPAHRGVTRTIVHQAGHGMKPSLPNVMPTNTDTSRANTEPDRQRAAQSAHGRSHVKLECSSRSASVHTGTTSESDKGEEIEEQQQQQQQQEEEEEEESPIWDDCGGEHDRVAHRSPTRMDHVQWQHRPLRKHPHKDQRRGENASTRSTDGSNGTAAHPSPAPSRWSNRVCERFCAQKERACLRGCLHRWYAAMFHRVTTEALLGSEHRRDDDTQGMYHVRQSRHDSGSEMNRRDDGGAAWDSEHDTDRNNRTDRHTVDGTGNSADETHTPETSRNSSSRHIVRDDDAGGHDVAEVSWVVRRDGSDAAAPHRRSRHRYGLKQDDDIRRMLRHFSTRLRSRVWAALRGQTATHSHSASSHRHRRARSRAHSHAARAHVHDGSRLKGAQCTVEPESTPSSSASLPRDWVKDRAAPTPEVPKVDDVPHEDDTLAAASEDAASSSFADTLHIVAAAIASDEPMREAGGRRLESESYSHLDTESLLRRTRAVLRALRAHTHHRHRRHEPGDECRHRPRRRRRPAVVRKQTTSLSHEEAAVEGETGRNDDSAGKASSTDCAVRRNPVTRDRLGADEAASATAPASSNGHPAPLAPNTVDEPDRTAQPQQRHSSPLRTLCHERVSQSPMHTQALASSSHVTLPTQHMQTTPPSSSVPYSYLDNECPDRPSLTPIPTSMANSLVRQHSASPPQTPPRRMRHQDDSTGTRPSHSQRSPATWTRVSMSAEQEQGAARAVDERTHTLLSATQSQPSSHARRVNENVRKNADDDDDDDDGEAEMRYYYRTGSRFVRLPRARLTCSHDRRYEGVRGRDSNVFAGEATEEKTGWCGADGEGHKNDLSVDDETIPGSRAVNTKHAAAQEPPCVYVTRRTETGHTAPVRLGRLNPYCEVCCAKFSYIWCNTCDTADVDTRIAEKRANGHSNIKTVDNYYNYSRKVSDRGQSARHRYDRGYVGRPASSSLQHREFGEVATLWLTSPQLREECRWHAGHLYGSADAALGWACERAKHPKGQCDEACRYDRVARHVRQPMNRASHAERAYAEVAQQHEAEEKGLRVRRGGDDVASALSALRRRERRLRRRMKQLLWCDLPAQRNSAEWVQYVDSLSEGVRMMSNIRSEGGAMVRSIA